MSEPSIYVVSETNSNAKRTLKKIYTRKELKRNEQGKIVCWSGVIYNNRTINKSMLKHLQKQDNNFEIIIDYNWRGKS